MAFTLKTIKEKKNQEEQGTKRVHFIDNFELASYMKSCLLLEIWGGKY